MASDLNAKPEVKEILKWERDGLMRPERVLERLDVRLDEFFWLKDTEKAALRQNFDANSVTGSDGEDVWDEAIFIKFLVASGWYKNTQSLIDASPILFHILLHLATFPFRLTQQNSTLSYRQLSRSLFWLLPEPAGLLFGGSAAGDRIAVRARTPTDTRRLLFESLADTPSQSLRIYNESLANEVEEQKGEGLDDVSINFAVTNYDRDGDQLYHDILDVFSATQPVDFPYGGHYRDDFRQCAKRLHIYPSLDQLQIPKNRLEKILRLLINGRDSDPSARSEKSAAIIVRGLANSNGVISWYDFDREQSRRTPYLLPELYDIFSPLLRNTRSAPTAPIFDQTTSAILTSSLLCQLNFILAGTVSLDNIQAFYQTTSTANLHVLVESLKKSSDFGLLLISGSSNGNSTSSPNSHLFAFFSPSPSEDEKVIEDREDPAWETALIVQLEPVFDVFRGCVGESAWICTHDELIFSNYKEISQFKVSGGAQQLSIVRKGSEIEELAVTRIEVWGE